MKSFFLRTTLLAFGLIMETSVWAATTTFKYGGIGYQILSTTDLTVAVVNAARPGTITNLPVANVNYKGNVVIPETIRCNVMGSGTKTYTVTTIVAEAFKYGSAMTSLTIPATVTSIGSKAFDGAIGLETLTLADKEDDGTQLTMASTKNCPLKTAYIGRTVKGLDYAENITFGPLVKVIENSAFYGNAGIRKLVIPNTITQIGRKSFFNCQNLNVIIIEDGDTELNIASDGSYRSNNAFDFSSIDSLYIGRNISVSCSIGQDYNTGISNVKHLVFGNQVTSIGKGAFQNSTVLKTVHVGLFCKFTSSCSTETYTTPSKLKGTKKCNHGKVQIEEFCRAKPAFKSEQDLTVY